MVEKEEETEKQPKKETNGGRPGKKKTSHSLLRQIEAGVAWLDATRKTATQFAFQVLLAAETDPTPARPSRISGKGRARLSLYTKVCSVIYDSGLVPD